MEVVEDEQEGIKYFKDVVSMEIPIPKKNPDGSVLREDGRVVYEKKEIDVCSISVVALEDSDKLPYHKHLLSHSFYKDIEGEGTLIANDKSINFSGDVYMPAKVPHTIKGDVSFICIEAPPDDNDFIPLE